MPGTDRRVRLRFDALELNRTPDGRCKVVVQVDWTEGRSYAGTAEGTQTPEGELRAAAAAALDAATAAVAGQLSLRLSGAKAIRVFDHWVAVTMVRAQAEGRRLRMLGAVPCDSEEDLPRAAVLAVFDATNRILERHLPPGGPSTS